MGSPLPREAWHSDAPAGAPQKFSRVPAQHESRGDPPHTLHTRRLHPPSLSPSLRLLCTAIWKLAEYFIQEFSRIWRARCTGVKRKPRPAGEFAAAFAEEAAPAETLEPVAAAATPEPAVEAVATEEPKTEEGA